MPDEEKYLVCERCGTIYEMDFPNRHCSNCFACTGCEIYYCPSCDQEKIVTPKKKSSRKEE